MDIICARCGRHFSSVEDAREHRGHCDDTPNDQPIRFSPAPYTKITADEWAKLMSIINNPSPPTSKPSPPEIKPEPQIIRESTTQNSGQTYSSKSKENPTSHSHYDNKSKQSTQIGEKWFVILVLFLSLTFVGIILSTFIGNSIPFWLLITFSVIFSIEKWFYYYTRKSKWLGRFYRVTLNLSLLSFLGLLIWSGIKLFSQQFTNSPLIGAILFLAEFIYFIWLWKVVTRNGWRWPSMKLTMFSLICLFVIFSFAGVQPMSSYKDTILNKIQIAFSNQNNKSVLSQPTTTITKYTTQPTTTIVSTIVTIPTRIPVTSTQIATQNLGINTKTGTYKNYYLGLVNASEGNLSGDGCYDDTGNFIVLINNQNAINPTYNQLVYFLQNDKTDQYPYTYTNPIAGFYYGTAESHVDLKNIQNIIDGTQQPGKPDVCADFAERLHNNAEMAGIRCAYVSIHLSGYSDPYGYGIPANTGHALCAFDTTDRGLVYIDCTGTSESNGPSSCDKIVDVQIGKPFIPESIFPEPGWYSTWENMGTVTDIFMTWDGIWNT